jgi:hypothetical protein
MEEPQGESERFATVETVPKKFGFPNLFQIYANFSQPLLRISQKNQTCALAAQARRRSVTVANAGFSSDRFVSGLISLKSDRIFTPATRIYLAFGENRERRLALSSK